MIAVYLARSAALPGVHPVLLAVSCFAVLFVWSAATQRRLSRLERGLVAAVVLAVAFTAIDHAAVLMDGCPLLDGSWWWYAAFCWIP